MNTVYLVDDDPLVLDYLLLKRGLFAECGFEICGAETNPLKALEEIREKRPNVVLSDLKMPELSGVELFDALSGDIFKPMFVIISAYNEFADVRKILAQAEYRGFDYILKPISDHTLADLLTRLSAEISHETAGSGAEPETMSRQLNGILKHMRAHPTMNHTLESLSERFSVNPTGICNLFAKHLNTTFRAHLTKLRMERAEELLRVTDHSVKEVGIHCGYANYFHFTQLFDKTYGKTPTEYRRELREK
jgi:two-component system response regulator YesN